VKSFSPNPVYFLERITKAIYRAVHEIMALPPGGLGIIMGTLGIRFSGPVNIISTAMIGVPAGAPRAGGRSRGF
jgi:hypothetical protein